MDSKHEHNELDTPDELVSLSSEVGGQVFQWGVTTDVVENFAPDPEHVRRYIAEYVEMESDDKVTYVEKMREEFLLGRKTEAFDVHTTGGRYWVITPITNLYEQSGFPSLDFALTFHVGMEIRLAARPKPDATEAEHNRFQPAWRRWEQAAEAFDGADEAEEFQAVGMRCRECLLAFSQLAAAGVVMDEAGGGPLAGDFIGWTDLLVNWVARGERNSYVRKYLKDVAKSTWQLANWLTHSTSATRNDAEIVVDATHDVLRSFGTAVSRREVGTPDKCPECGSYQIEPATDYNAQGEKQYLIYCSACGWNRPQHQ